MIPGTTKGMFIGGKPLEASTGNSRPKENWNKIAKQTRTVYEKERRLALVDESCTTLVM